MCHPVGQESGFEMNKQVYTFGGGIAHDDPRARDKVILGGKGANLAEMAGIGLPVPPGSSPRRVPISIARWASNSATPPIPCWSRCAPARACRCPA